MKGLTTFRNTTIIISLLVVIVLLLTLLVNKQKRKADIDNASGTAQFAGSEVCSNCHKQISESHVNTAHYLTSRPATDKFIKGSFKEGHNVFSFNDSVGVAMEKRDSTFYQVEYINGVQKRKYPFDIVVGSATKGQSYLHWQKGRLFQLPITYFTQAQQWSNSPGFPGKVVFNRPITSRCLECHTTSIEMLSAKGVEQERFGKNRVVYGVDCEKCHGPALKHVKFQTENPNERRARFIINPSGFTRQQSLDLCALCHGGRLSKTKPSFSFKPGDKLSEYFNIEAAGKDAIDIDVHGNQLGLLAASECFKKTSMTCNSCHSSHENERGKLNVLSEKCMTCHNDKGPDFCKIAPVVGNSIRNNCIDCHMPNQPSKSIAVFLQGSNTPTSALMRTHLIKIYPEETKKFMDKAKRTEEIRKYIHSSSSIGKASGKSVSGK